MLRTPTTSLHMICLCKRQAEHPCPPHAHRCWITPSVNSSRHRQADSCAVTGLTGCRAGREFSKSLRLPPRVGGGRWAVGGRPLLSRKVIGISQMPDLRACKATGDWGSGLGRSQRMVPALLSADSACYHPSPHLTPSTHILQSLSITL